MVWTFVPLSNGGFTLIDAADYERVSRWRWLRAKVGYAVCTSKRIGYLHRYLLGLRRGDKRHTDHINRDSLDNRRCNLRVVTCAQNRQNVPSYRGSSSPHRGVCWDRGKWKAYATVGGTRTYLGRFSSEHDAAAAAAEFRAKHMPFAEA